MSKNELVAKIEALNEWEAIMEEKQTILAAGAGASTKFVFEHGTRIERVENVKDVNNYILRIDEMLERKRVGIQKYLNG